jgi:subtilisin-like proprotein convertase family protein
MSGRHARSLGLALLVLGAWAVLAPTTVAATVTTHFANTTAITIPDVSLASPYPSPILVTGLPGAIQKVTVTLVGLSHTGPSDLDVLLLGPGGQTVMLLSDAAPGPDAVNLTLTFDDDAGPAVTAPISSGTFRPTDVNDGADVMPAAPPGPYGTALSVFDGTSANGFWWLFVLDDAGVDFGSIAGGWRLTITAAEPGGTPPEVFSRVSVDSSGAQGNAGTGLSYLSANDGRFVVFASAATNLASNCANGAGHIYVHDRVTGATTCVSVASDGTPGNGLSSRPAISGDGRLVVFYSDASNLVSNDTNGVTDVFVHDRVTGITTRASVATGGAEGNGASLPAQFNATSPAISTDGRVVAFVSVATNLAAGCDVPGFSYILTRDLVSGTTTCATVSPGGQAGNGVTGTNEPKLSADGRFVLFRTEANNLDPRCPNILIHVYVRYLLVVVIE